MTECDPSYFVILNQQTHHILFEATVLYSSKYSLSNAIWQTNPSHGACSELLLPSYSGLIEPSKKTLMLIEEGGSGFPLLTEFLLNVKRYRQALGISQEAFAEKCSLHRTYISAIEFYRRSISLENIQRIADALGVETYKLFWRDELCSIF